eukprot:CAMPEP_0115888452 /NCGR_PEP_ID=MMETSP0287-20121206/32314_1 /TAXON_ID=412157 /ORGANISM="Chrysochromulina rotalis, Strain UIO044" /LENGTH=180 /DNA_ID=CAMNT_0003345135 /DNA_START=64 /DNA_END=606 /DNA_ORIENTATION=+
MSTQYGAQPGYGTQPGCGTQQGYGNQPGYGALDDQLGFDTQVTGWHLFPRGPRGGRTNQVINEYKVPLAGQQVLGRFDVVEQENQYLTISREQCVVQVAPDGSATLTSTGKPATGWRTGPTVPWTWLQNGQSITLGPGHKISLDQTNPDLAIYVCQPSASPLQQSYDQTPRQQAYGTRDS